MHQTEGAGLHELYLMLPYCEEMTRPPRARCRMGIILLWRCLTYDISDGKYVALVWDWPIELTSPTLE